ncbi:MAG TPA: hypothetical protein VHL59_09150 [Thermoanaerobaculia bacterium]|nr:hypothetical protein [Thermoanaerobaculia bacterium]
MTLPLLDAAVPLNPFPGLRPFEPEEDYLFFGRERQTDDLLRKLRTTRFLSILGRSGSGKSSLVRSGMIPSLYGGGMTKAGSRWRVAIMRPGDDPLGNLAAALASPMVLGPPDDDEGLSRSFFETTLRAGHRGLVECIEQARLDAGENILVLVDQFEELFRYKRSRRLAGRDEAVAFAKLLLTARSSGIPCYITITMRSDFVGDCMEFGDLPEAINDGLYLVPRMTREELKLAITGPVAVGGARIAQRLVSRLLNDVGDDPDQLPILQHALMRTWERWEGDHQPGEPLDLHHYEAIGTLRTALSRHAEEAFDELSPPRQQVAERMFKALTDTGSDTRGLRRPAPVSEIAALAGTTVEEVAAVAEPFRQPGRSFLVPAAGVPLHAGSILDISHESLMRIWGRLAAWTEEEMRSAQLYLNVAKAAARHEQGIAALWRDPELQLALTWREKERPTEAWAERYDPSFGRAMAFLDASRHERDRELHEKNARRRRELRLARALIAILSTATLVTLVLGGYGLVQKRKAVAAQRQAEQEEALAKQALVRVRQERARAEEQKRRAETQRAIAVEQRLIADDQRRNAEQQTAFATQQKVIAETERLNAEKERLNAEINEREARRQKEQADVARGQAVTEKTKAETSETETRRLSHLAAARALALTIVKQSDQQELSALLALEVYRLHRASSGDAQDPDVFAAMRAALARLQPLPAIRGEHDSIRGLAVTPDGRAAFVGSEDGRIVRLPLGGGKPEPVSALPSAVRAVALRPAGDLLAVAAAGGNVRLVDLRQPKQPHRDLAESGGTVSSLAFDRSGAHLAAGGLDGSVRVWDVAGNGAPVTLPNASGKRVLTVGFHGTTLAAGLAAKGGALVWNVAQPSAPPRAVCEGVDVSSVAFRPDGAVLACGSVQGQILQAPLRAAEAALPPLLGHRSRVNALAFDRNGSRLASASSDGSVRIWNVGDASQQPIVLTGHDSWVWTVAFSPDGERLISGGQDRTVRIWPARAEVLAGDLCAQVNARLSRKRLTAEEWRNYMPSDIAYRQGAPCPAGL